MTWTSNKIREQYLSYFESKGHKRIRSSSLIPLNDPTLLFTNAGMNQFKDIFVGKIQRPAPCATTSQKCMRVSGKHNDLENVGRTARHHTFFEMLGNFSFGDYFKREAIRYAWELVTEVYGFDVANLWVTIFEKDDEAHAIWTKEIGVSPERVVRMGEKDNFWSMGPVGPCGPCTEIHYDQGDGPDGIWKNEDIFGDSDRFLEFWNLVFMQFDRHEDGSMTNLPSPSVDTGGGLERFAAILQGKNSNYETDLFQPIIQKVAQLSKKSYRASVADDTSMQVIADHVRATTFLVGDGQLPSNEFRGYVLRRIMRRAIRHGSKLGLADVFMPSICEVVIDQMKDSFPELERNRDFILNVVGEEEKGFRRTLSTGLDMLNNELDRVERDGGDVVSGAVAFKLYDTFGFPVDLTGIIARERGKGVDMQGFEKEMAEQRERGRASWKGAGGKDRGMLYGQALEAMGAPTIFTGYETEQDAATLKALVGDEKLLDLAVEGQDIELILDRTPFYAESGGQVGDQGLILSKGATLTDLESAMSAALNGQTPDCKADFIAVVTDTLRPLDGLVIHKARVLKGDAKPGLDVQAVVHHSRRSAIRGHHSATHLLQYALRRVLGEHVKQSGSWVGPERLRFDFTHFSAIEPAQVELIERLVAEKILVNALVTTDVKNLEQAQAEGAIAFFGEKYGDTVRVVSMTKDAVELCGGTHVARTGDIGSFKIVTESSIASGVRRIEAVTGMAALLHIQQEARALREAASLLSCSPTGVPEGVKQAMEQQRIQRKKIEALEKEKAAMQSAGIVDQAIEINGIKVLCATVNDVDPKAFRDYGLEVMNKLGNGVACLSLLQGDKANLLVAVSESLRKTLPAGKVIAEVAVVAGGRGGGRPDLAQAGGADPALVEQAFARLKELVAAL
jgi:alanyl-tRNA synthetase